MTEGILRFVQDKCTGYLSRLFYGRFHRYVHWVDLLWNYFAIIMVYNILIELGSNQRSNDNTKQTLSALRTKEITVIILQSSDHHFNDDQMCITVLALNFQVKFDVPLGVNRCI